MSEDADPSSALSDSDNAYSQGHELYQKRVKIDVVTTGLVEQQTYPSGTIGIVTDVWPEGHCDIDVGDDLVAVEIEDVTALPDQHASH